MTERIVDRTLIGRAAEHLLFLPYETWHFGDSVGFEALQAATRVTGDQRFAAFAHGFFRSWASRAKPYQPLDHTAPGLAMVQCAEATGDDRLLDAAARLAEHLTERRTLHGVYATWEQSPLRLPYGPVRLTPDEALLVHNPGAGIFVDCLHFDPPFFASLGRVGGDSAFTRLAIEQALGYIALLQDPKTGLFAHFWLERTGRTYAPGWGRGQGWALLGLLDVLEQVGRRGDFAANPDKADSASVTGAGQQFEASRNDELTTIATSARRLADAMIEHQRADGSWFAVVQDQDSGNEASTAAFMAVAFARGQRLGLFDDRFTAPRSRALGSVLAGMDDRAVLRDVSAAVWACTHPGHYAHVPRGFLVPWGQGPCVLALAEAGAARDA